MKKLAVFVGLVLLLSASNNVYADSRHASSPSLDRSKSGYGLLMMIRR